MWLSILPLVLSLLLFARGVMYSKFVLPKSSVEVPCVGGPVWTYGENPSV